jgi:hypothetical protein
MKTGAVSADHSLTLVARNGAATVRERLPRHVRGVFKGVDAAGKSACATKELTAEPYD